MCLGGSPSPLARLVLLQQGSESLSPLPLDHLRSAAGPVSGAGQRRLADAMWSGCVCTHACPHLAGDGSAVPLHAREKSCAAVLAPCPRWRGKGWTPGSVGRHFSGATAPLPLPRHRVRGRCHCHAATITSTMLLPWVGVVKEQGWSGLAGHTGRLGVCARATGGS